MNDTHQEHVRENYDAFMEKLPELMQSHPGEFALMHGGEIQDFYQTAIDAATAGNRIYPDGDYSIQEVTGDPINLGFFSYAGL